VLDSNVPLAPGSPQAEWLQQTLNSPAAKESIWRVAFFHHPPYSAAKRGNRPQLIHELLPVLESSNVQLVLSGHDHCYQRLEPPPVTQGHQSKITYLVSGGGGASLSKQAAQPEYLKAYGATYHYLELTADQSRLGITARTVDGTSIDQFFITQAPAQN
jgi:3',5'-cyclic AMP phosphodiesterase CpdA